MIACLRVYWIFFYPEPFPFFSSIGIELFLLRKRGDLCLPMNVEENFLMHHEMWEKKSFTNIGVYAPLVSLRIMRNFNVNIENDSPNKNTQNRRNKNEYISLIIFLFRHSNETTSCLSIQSMLRVERSFKRLLLFFSVRQRESWVGRRKFFGWHFLFKTNFY